MKNIAIILTSYTFGGTERFAITLYRILEKLGYNVHLITIVKSNTIQVENIKYYNLDVGFAQKCSVFKPFYLKKYLIQNKIDVVIDNRPVNSIFKTLFYNIILTGITKIKVIHNEKLAIYLFKNKAINQLFFGCYYKIICINNLMEQQVYDLYKLKNLQTIYNPIPIINFEADSLNIQPYILYFGRLENKSKDLFFLLNAFKKSKLIVHNVKLIILGSGPDFEAVFQKVTDLNLQDSVIFKPAQSNPFNYVKQALFTVLTSNYEGFPMSMIESLSIGTPIVSVNFGAAAEQLITNKYNGLLVEKDLNLFSDALNLMVDDTKLYTHCKKNAKLSVAHLSANEIAKKWDSLLKTI